MDRTTINIGPGMITWDGATIHVEDDIQLTMSPALFDVPTAAHGVVDRRREDFTIEVTGTPTMWNDLAKLLPYASLEVGASIYGATDKPLVIKPRTGLGWTLTNAAITKMPDITLTANRAPLGSMTWTGLLANSGDPHDIADYLATSAAGALTGFDLTKVPTGLYTASWGAVLSAFHSEDGFAITFDMQTEDVKIPGRGTIDKILTGLSASCKVVPVGPDQQDILDVHGLTTHIGQPGPKNDIVITGGRNGMPIVTLKNCIAQSSQGRTGRSAKRIGEMEFVTIRTATNGVIDPLWTIGTVGA
ncbi:MAG: hypothetical protein Fur0032_21000 [Terrimicrobiaceae bacterium]